ncbi:DUF2778 domain-containing protein [Pararhizobium sp.]|uniref:DUF2778 domain-containing protein n=1 Tax=Pararhizobium sp. TaxID=1977563 RepID=UPI00271955A9|nr:DUF2778 domain-containing protein [Pararhizobium sp.]MDO9418806.1 DUF2778 domain-containing protein [Pararhizobium sp.]
MTPVLSAQDSGKLQASLGLKAVVETEPHQRLVHIRKFSRLSSQPVDQAERDRLTADLIVKSHHKMAAVKTALLQKKSNEKARAFAVAAAQLRAEKAVAEARQQAGQPILVTALVENKPLEDGTMAKPFGLVLAEQQGPSLLDSVSELPETIPLPEARPERLAKAVPDVEVKPEAVAKAVIETPEDETKQTREALAKETLAKTKADAKAKAEAKADKQRTVANELAYAKPNKTLFDGLFGGGESKRGWPGSGTRVAIYDISAGRVYMPDGSKLEAHSGIDEARDNPRFVHKKMRGSTPPGTFKLTMREKRFHGVEALRMTPVNGVHPHGRTGLLTHSYLLGKNGNSHGCVAFRDYQPFLKAFKRGKIDTLIVVPSLPKSRTQIASLISRGA